jgi:hypothetical protein
MTALRIAAAAALVLALRNGPARAEASDRSPARASAVHGGPARTAVQPKSSRATRAPKAPLRRMPTRDRSTDLELPQLG